MADTLILGAGGMLGQDLTAQLRHARIPHRPLRHADCDLRDPAALAAAIHGADCIVNCAAYTAVDRAESEPQLARAVNADAVATLGRLAAAAGAYVLHLSTDFVFDGAQTRPYTEADTPNPISVYGATKRAGELALQASGAPHAILRVQWTYGRHGAHFISKILERAHHAGALTVVDDQIGAPTPTTWIATVITQFLAERRTGLYHAAAAGYASRYAVARFVLDQRGLSDTVRCTPCASSAFSTPAARPLSSRFDCSRLDAILYAPRPAWQDALAHYLETAP